MSGFRSAELLSAVFEATPDAIVLLDSKTQRIVDANPAACEMYGYSREELTRLRITDVSAEPDKTSDAIARRVIHIHDRLHRRSDGTTFPVEISANDFVVDGRRLRLGFIRDISERRRAEEALRSSEARFSAAFRTTPDAVNINRLSDGLFLDVNDGFTQLTGYTPEDVAGKTSLEVSIWADPADRARLVAGLAAEGRVENLEADFRSKSGELRPGLMSARLVTIDGELSILSVTRDISSIRQHESLLLAMNERLAGMVHDVAEAMGRAVETRDPYTQGHMERVAHLGTLIAAEMGMGDDDTAAIEIAGLLHDVGKLGVPAELLNKPGALSAVEFKLITRHSQLGHDILSDIPFPWPVADIVLQHHERVDGTGYPGGLAGEDILPAARVLAVADVVEAMASFRPYRPARGLEAAMAEVTGAGGRYDSHVVAAAARLWEAGSLAFLEA